MMTKLMDVLGSSALANDKPESGGDGKRKQFQQWCYENPDNEKTKLMRGTTMKWCTNNCHNKAM